MIKITLPDGSVKEFAQGVTPMDVAKSISEGLARNVISASFNGTIVETVTELTTDAEREGLGGSGILLVKLR
mgnify:CR=1 FL=1